jgi:putative ABC transport system permease protein
MEIRENFYLSLRGLMSHKLRTFLTMLGIIFGVAAVLSMLSIGAGARQEALAQIKQMGLNNIILNSKQIVSEEDEDGSVIEAAGLTIGDTNALRKLNPLINAAIPQQNIEDIRIAHGRERTKCMVVGTVPMGLSVNNYELMSGSIFNYYDLSEAKRVCVLGSAIKRELFYFREAVGELVKVGDIWFTVVGVLQEIPQITGSGGMADTDLNRNIYVPLTTMRMRAPRDLEASDVDIIVLQVADTERIREAATLAKELILIRHNGKEDFRIVIPELLLRQSQKTQRVFNIVMGAIAGISLLVGGIGIMNIMLASILERTREIGIRRAVGATRNDIMGQFLIEAILLSFTGGFIGVFLGFLMTRGIAEYAHWKTIIEISAVLLSFGVSTIVGIVFGFYPARKAALLNPIESLRHE